MQAPRNLLSSHQHLIREGQTSLLVHDWESDRDVEIPLDPTRSPRDAIRLYYEATGAPNRHENAVNELKRVQEELRTHQAVFEAGVRPDSSPGRSARSVDEPGRRNGKRADRETKRGPGLSKRRLYAACRSNAKKTMNFFAGTPEATIGGFIPATFPAVMCSSNTSKTSLLRSKFS